MKKYNIFGAIVDNECDKYDACDLTLKDFAAFVDTIEDNEEVEFVFNSPGGSVLTGVAIANKVKALTQKGVKTTAKVEGVCASIATCIACACDKIVMGKGSFFMIHNCWSIVQGDSNTLRKEADIMEKMNEAILSFYRSKFDRSDEEIRAMMDNETWISSMDAKEHGLVCEVIDDGDDFALCASISRYNFKNIPRGLTMENKEEDTKVEEEQTKEEVKEEETKVEEEQEQKEEQEEQEEKPQTEEEKKVEGDEEPQPTIEELEKRIEELTKENEELKAKVAECGEGDKEEEKKEDLITKAECEKRVSGM